MMSEVISTKCPFTQRKMQHPLRNRHCGHCYDRESVKELIRHRGDKARLVKSSFLSDLGNVDVSNCSFVGQCINKL
jgi:hypothetical protein